MIIICFASYWGTFPSFLQQLKHLQREFSSIDCPNISPTTKFWMKSWLLYVNHAIISFMTNLQDRGCASSSKTWYSFHVFVLEHENTPTFKSGASFRFKTIKQTLKIFERLFYEVKFLPTCFLFFEVPHLSKILDKASGYTKWLGYHEKALFGVTTQISPCWLKRVTAEQYNVCTHRLSNDERPGFWAKIKDDKQTMAAKRNSKCLSTALLYIGTLWCSD